MARFLALCLFMGACGCSGTINEYLLLARKGDEEEVLEAVLMVGVLLAEKERGGYSMDEGDREAVEFLRTVALNHGRPDCRMRAISGLRNIRRVDSTSVFLEALRNDHWGVRMEAARALAERPSPDASPALAEQLRKEPLVEVRVYLIKALAKVGDRVALKVLLEVLLDEKGRYEGNKIKAYNGIKAISGLNYALFDPKAWRKYYDAEFPKEPAKTLPGVNPEANKEPDRVEPLTPSER